MNLEKTINKNMFDMSTSIRDKNPLETPDLIKTDQTDTMPTPLSSILSHPKQRLTAQFKRAITMIRQRSEPARESSPPKFQTSISLHEKPHSSFDANLLTSLIEESTQDNPPTSSTELLPSKSSSCTPMKPLVMRSTSNQDTDSSSTTAPTVVGFDSTVRINQQNPNSSPSYLIKTNLQKIHASPLETVKQQAAAAQLSSSSSATLSPTPISATGEITIYETIL